MPGDVQLKQDTRTGEIWAYAPGAAPRLVSPEQAQMIASGEGAAASFGKSMLESVGQIATGGASMLAPDARDRELARQAFEQSVSQQGARAIMNPLSSMAGSIVPDLAIGAVTAGQSVPAMVGLEAAIGAARTPDNPLMGAALQGGLAGVGPAIGAAARAMPSVNLGGLGESLTMAQAALPGSMGQRAVARIERQAAAENAARGGLGGGGGGIGSNVPPGAPGGAARPHYAGYLSPDEAKAIGLPTTAGDDLALGAMSAEQAGYANRIRRAEELRRTDQLTGGPVIAAREGQKDWLTGRIAQAIGSEDQALTPAALGAVHVRLGNEFENFANQLGHVDLSPRVFANLDGIVEHAHSGYKPWLQKIVKDVQDKAEQNLGSISAADWAYTRHELNRGIEAATGQGNAAKIFDARMVMEQLQNAIESTLPKESRDAIKLTRQQYEILKTLESRQGNVNSSGQVNAQSFAGSWGKNPRRFVNAMGNQLQREIDTVRFLQTQLVPSSGTAERILANPVRALANPVSGGMLSGVATLGLSGLFGGGSGQ